MLSDPSSFLYSLGIWQLSPQIIFLVSITSVNLRQIYEFFNRNNKFNYYTLVTISDYIYALKSKALSFCKSSFRELEHNFNCYFPNFMRHLLGKSHTFFFFVLSLNEIKWHQGLETECCILIEFQFFLIISLKLLEQFNQIVIRWMHKLNGIKISPILLSWFIGKYFWPT